MHRAQILPISSVTPTHRREWRDEAVLEGFTKALGVLHSLQLANWREAQIAIENWVRSGKLTREEADTFLEFQGWERAP